MSIPDCTLTTSIYDLNPFHNKSRPLDISINNISSLLSVPCYLVIYGDSTTIPEVKKIRAYYNLDHLTIYHEVPLQNIWTYQYIEKVRKNREIYWPTRDERTCPENHILVCNKFDFVQKTIESNPFNTSKFGWIDAHMEKFCVDFSPEKLIDLLNNITPKFHIQILNVVDKKYKILEHRFGYYRSYPWLVCGCLFTCSPEVGMPILNRLKELFIQDTELGVGHAEEALYLDVLDEFYDDIVRSYGDYGQIVNNFHGATLNIDYIFYAIFERYHKYGYQREAIDCGMHLIKQFRKGLNIDYDKLAQIYFLTYVNSFYINFNQAKDLVKEIRELVKNNKFFENSYNKNSEFYNSQLKFAE